MRPSSLKQLAMRPRGLAGRLFGILMERLNERAYQHAAALVAPRPGERFLEIGFGTGRLVEILLAAAPGVEVAGVDPTPTMVEVASARPSVVSAGGRVDLRVGLDAPLPWPDHHFDAAAALHSFQFWPRPEESFQEILRVLRPGGRLVLVFRDHSRNPPQWLPNPISRNPTEVDDASRLMARCGFAVDEADSIGKSRVRVGRKPPLRSRA